MSYFKYTLMGILSIIYQSVFLSLYHVPIIYVPDVPVINCENLESGVNCSEWLLLFNMGLAH